MDRAGGPWLRLLLLFAFALALRAVYLLELSGSVLLDVLIGDGAEYDRWARALLADDGSAPEVFYQAPLYPYALAAVYRLAPSHVAVMWGQALFGAGACVLLALAGRRWFDARTGWIAGVLLALYPFALFYTSLLQKTTLALFFLCAVLLLLAHARAGRGLAFPFAAGAALGALCLLRENALALVPVVPLCVAVGPAEPGHGSARRALRAAAVVAGVLLLLAPVAWRNAERGGGGLLPTTFQLGTNLHAGNFRGSAGRYVPPREGAGFPGREQDDAWQLAEAAAGRPLTPAEVSSHWTREALAEVRADPVAWLRLMAFKTLLLVNAEEVLDIEAHQVFADESRLLRGLAAVLHFGVLFPLAVWGVVATAGRWRRLWPLYAVFLTLAGSVVVFFVLGRLRLPLVPIAALFAAAGVAALPALREASARTRLACAACLAIGALACNWPLPGGVPSPRAATWNDLGVALRQQGRDDEALAWFERSLLRDPDYYRAHLNRGELLRARGEPAAGLASIRQAVALRPDSAVARLYLARALMDAGRTADALAAARRALALDPGHVGAESLVGLLLLREGRADEALPHLRRYVARRPDDPRGHNNLGAALLSSGREDEARAAFQAALRADPGHAGARANLERLGP
ncbi:MAG: tetratricopeptide repeat protein [Myxococcota bacterium]